MSNASLSTNKLYSLGKKVTVKDISDCYSYIAYKTNLGKLITLNDIANEGILSNLPQWLLKELNNNPMVMYPSWYEGTNNIYQLTLRNITKKQFMTYNTNGCPYGLMFFKGFTFNQPILITEGIKDCIACATQVYPYTLAMSGASISQKMLKVLYLLTRRVIINTDNDKTGNQQFYQIQKNLTQMGFDVQRLNQPQGIKDMGTILDNEYNGADVQKQWLINYYDVNLKTILSRW